MMTDDLYLAHHGVKGQKWGVRRYENKGGSYTRAGLQRYKNSQEKYAAAKETYKLIKSARKGMTLPNGETIYSTKQDLKSGKAWKKAAKQQLNKDYKHLKLDYKADKGKARYQSGQTITGRSEAARILGSIGSLTIAGSNYAYRSGMIDSKQTKILGGVGAAALGAAAISKVINTIGDNELRAYYSHTSKY